MLGINAAESCEVTNWECMFCMNNSTTGNKGAIDKIYLLLIRRQS